MSTAAARLNGAQITSLGACPVASGAGGLWWDGNTSGPKWRKADGTDVTLGAGGGGSTLSAAYAAGAGQADSTMTLDSTRLGVRILDAASTINTLFTIANNAASTNYFQITTNAQQLIKCAMADGASAVALGVDTTTTWSNATAKLLRLLSNGSEKYSFTPGGTINTPANTTLALGSASTNTTALTTTTNVADGASSIAELHNNTTSLANATSKLLSWQNAGSEKFSILGNGNLNLVANGSVLAGSAATNTTGLTIKSNVADGASSIGMIFDNAAALSTAGYKSISIRNNNVEDWYFDRDSGLYPRLNGTSGTANELAVNGTICASFITSAWKFFVDPQPDADGSRNLGTASVRFGALFNSGRLSGKYNTQSGTTYTVVANDDYVGLSNSGARTVTLCAANAMIAGQELIIKDENGNAATNNITINRASTDTIDGATSKVINTNFGRVVLRSDGSGKWFIVVSQ